MNKLPLRQLIVTTVEDSYVYQGDDATEVFYCIDQAAARGAAWTPTIDIEYGSVIFVIDKIVRIDIIVNEEEAE